MARKTKAEKAMDQRVDKIAQAATTNNPIPIMRLSDLAKVVRRSIEAHNDDAKAIEDGRKFIQSIT